MITCVNDGVTTIKTWTSDSWKRTREGCSLYQEDFTYVCRAPTEACNPQSLPGSNSEAWRRFCDGLGSNIMVQYSVSPIITVHG
jgi:hypothetical protein